MKSRRIMERGRIAWVVAALSVQIPLGIAGGDRPPANPEMKHLFYDAREHDPHLIPIELGKFNQAIARVHLEERADEIGGFLCMCLSDPLGDGASRVGTRSGVKTWFLGSERTWAEADRVCTPSASEAVSPVEGEWYLRGTPFFHCRALQQRNPPAFQCRCETAVQVGEASRERAVAEFARETATWFLRSSAFLTPDHAELACAQEGAERFFQTGNQAGRVMPFPGPAYVGSKRCANGRLPRCEEEHYECQSVPLFPSVRPRPRD